jgi:hypothetical protein
MQTYFNYKNVILYIALVLIAALTLTACGDDGDTNIINPSLFSEQICTEVDQSHCLLK